MFERTLQNLGFTSTEAKLYDYLLRHGPLTAVRLAKGTGIHRRTVYDNLELLISRGAITVVKTDGVHVYNTVDPQVLHAKLKEQEFDLKKQLPQMRAIFDGQAAPDAVEVVRGTGAASLFIKEARQAGELIWLGGGLQSAPYLLRSHATMSVAKMPIRMIQPSTEHVMKSVKSFPNAKVRYMPESYATPVGYILFGETLVIGSYSDKMMSVIFRSQEFARAFRGYFELLWQSLPSRPERDKQYKRRGER